MMVSNFLSWHTQINMDCKTVRVLSEISVTDRQTDKLVCGSGRVQNNREEWRLERA